MRQQWESDIIENYTACQDEEHWENNLMDNYIACQDEKTQRQ